MTTFLLFFLLGLGTGGIYALLGLSIVIVYRGSGIVNFANGALAFIGAAIFYELRDSWGTTGAIIAGVVGTALVAGVMQAGIMGPMRRSSPLARVIATLGVMEFVLALATQHYGTDLITTETFLPTSTLEPFHKVFIGADRMTILGITIVITAVLYVIYRSTRFGLATAGVAENEMVTATLGWSPDLIATINWMAGGALAGFTGILLVPIVNLAPPTGLVLTIVPALAAALVGGFRSFPLTLLGGLLLGVLESLASYYIHTPGWAPAVPFLVIIVILVVRGRALPLRSHLAERLPKVGDGTIRWTGIAIATALTIGSLALFTSSWQDAVVTSLCYAFIGLSVVVVTGYCGQLSLTQFGLAGIGALISSRLADAGHVPFGLALVLGIILTIPAGIIIALPAVRVRGVNLAIVTLGMAVAIQSVVLSNPDYIGGIIRGTIVPKANLFGWNIFSIEHPDRYAGFALVLLIIATVLVANLRRGQTGRRLVAVRNNERAVASLGVSVIGAKLYAFGLGAALAALGGELIAFRNQNVSFDTFDPFTSIQVVLTTVIGGVGFIIGAIVGGASTPGAATQEILTHFIDLTGWYSVLLAGGLILVVMTNPNGIVEEWNRNARRLRARLTPTPKNPQPTTTPTTTTTNTHIVEPHTLHIDTLTLQFGAVTALAGATLEVHPGEIVGLIGPNGAGKTTLIDAVTGFHRNYTGTITIDGHKMDRKNPVNRARLGVTRSFQSLELFDDLNVEDNIRIGADPRNRLAQLTDLIIPRRPPLPPAATAAIEVFGLTNHLTQNSAALPYGQQRLVAIARSVATSPSILLLDEPAAGLDTTSTKELADLIKRLAREWGMGILLVEHNVSMVLNTCDRVIALDFGAIIAQGTPDEIRHNQAVIKAYLGETDTPPTTNPTPTPT
jgi:sulfate-transporting ATPase